ncbi:hypothetical protein HMPREF9098_0270 [Kingella denitrificans ATCC 33394]|uniref:Uncharacterized protein n=1 Tax=Kingella denitrificans ATCC 33394 TaxID=888741 RepID=F0EWP0_9NEIS|nr:hypothetical protein HMPREF9098_0270 [Kingella denitrificans ATCC 33394]
MQAAFEGAKSSLHFDSSLIKMRIPMTTLFAAQPPIAYNSSCPPTLALKLLAWAISLNFVQAPHK